MWNCEHGCNLCVGKRIEGEKRKDQEGSLKVKYTKIRGRSKVAFLKGFFQRGKLDLCPGSPGKGILEGRAAWDVQVPSRLGKMNNENIHRV